MSLVRTGLVIAAVIAVLPSDKGEQQRLYMQTAAAIDWAATYCDRNRSHCEKATEYWAIFKEKADFAGSLALDGFKRYALGNLETSDSPVAKTKLNPKRGTLTDEDLIPSWRGAERRI